MKMLKVLEKIDKKLDKLEIIEENSKPPSRIWKVLRTMGELVSLVKAFFQLNISLFLNWIFHLLWPKWLLKNKVSLWKKRSCRRRQSQILTREQKRLPPNLRSGCSKMTWVLRTPSIILWRRGRFFDPLQNCQHFLHRWWFAESCQNQDPCWCHWSTFCPRREPPTSERTSTAVFKNSLSYRFNSIYLIDPKIKNE